MPPADPTPRRSLWRPLRWALALAVLAGLGLLLWRGIYVDPSGGEGDSLAARPPADAGSSSPEEDSNPSHHASVSGTVLDPRGQPAEGALVWAVDSFEHLRQARTHADGRFVLAGLRPGQYRLAAQRGAETSDSQGPLPLGEGEDLRDLLLQLAPGAKLSGAVLDLHSRQPLPGAVVAVAATPLSAIADAQGRFALPPLPPGGHQLLVRAEGHQPRDIPLLARSGDNTRDLEVFLTPSTRLTGTVATKDGTGVPGAQLLLARYQAASATELLSPSGVVSDAAGHFSLDLAPGQVRVVARSTGFAEAVSEVVDLAEGKAQNVKLTLGAGAQVDGTVVGADGEAVAAGQVAAFRSNNGWQVGEARIATGGRFSVTGLPAGHLTLSADAAQARATAEVELEEGGSAQVQLRLGNGALEGLVVNGRDQPLAGALVVARPVGTAQAGERSALSGADGHFKVSGLAGTRYDVSATGQQADDGNAEVRGVASGRRDLRIVLAAGGVSGTVLGPGGVAVSDFYVGAEPELPGKGRPRATAAVDGRGEFRLSLSPGRYRLRATAPGFAEGVAEGIDVAFGAETAGVRIQLSPAGAIEGVVLEDKTNAPLAGVHVGTDRGHAWSVGRDSPLGGSAAVSGADGRFVLRDVAPGNWPLFASEPHHDQMNWQGVEVVAGKNPAPVEIRMRRREGESEQLYAGIGMSIFPQGDRKFAGEVFAGGPAQEAGIRNGDEILTVDGLTAQGRPVSELVQHIRGPQGSEVSLDLQRGQGEQYSVVVPRAEIRF